MKLIKIALIIFILIVLSYFIYNKIYSSEKEIIYDKKSALEQVIKKTKNIDDGFREYLPFDQQIDLYSTYYSEKILEVLEIGEKTDSIPTIDIDSILLNGELYDTNTNIFYFVSLYKDLLDKELKTKIIQYLKKSGNGDGTFSYSINKINESDDNNYNQYILSTYRALYSLISLDADMDMSDTEKILNEFYINKENFNAKNMQNSGYVLNILQMSQLLNFDYSEYRGTIETYMTQLNAELNNYLISSNPNLMNIYNVVELNNILYGSVDTINFSNLDILNFLKKFENKDSGYSIEPGVDSNIAPTYFALDIINKLGQKIQNSKEIIDFVKLYELKNGGYSQIINLPSNLSSSLIVNSIVTDTFPELYDSYSAEKFIIQSINDAKQFNIWDLYMYLLSKVSKECSECLNLNEIKALIEKEIKEIKEINTVNISMYIYYYLEIIKISNLDLPIDIKTHLKELLERENSNKSAGNNELLLIMIYHQLNLPINKEEIQNKIVNITVFDDILDLYFVSKVVVELNLNFNKEQLKKELIKFQNTDGTFNHENTIDSNSSYFSTYYGLEVFKFLN